MPKEITPLSAVLAAFVVANSYGAFKHLRDARYINAKSTHRAPSNGKCQLTGALEPLLEWSRTGSEENVSAVPPSPDRNPRRAIAEFW
jgi:hypothetical protein